MTKVYNEQKTEINIWNDADEQVKDFETAKAKNKKDADEAKEKHLKLLKEAKERDEAAEKILKQTQKYCDKYEKETGKKIAMWFITVDDKWYFQNWVSSSNNMNQFDWILMGNKLAGSLLNLVNNIKE